MSRQRKAPAVRQQFSAFGYSLVNILRHPLKRLFADQGAHVVGCVNTRPDFQVGDFFPQQCHGFICRLFANTNCDRDRHAALSTGAVSGSHERIYSVLKVGVRQNYCVILSPSKRLNTLTLGRATGKD